MTSLTRDSSVVSTHWVVNVDPLGCVGLHKLAINEQLGGGLRDHRGVLLSPPGYSCSLLEAHKSFSLLEKNKKKTDLLKYIFNVCFAKTAVYQLEFNK